MVGDEMLTNAEYAEASTSDLTSGVMGASIIASPIALMSSDYCWLYAWNGSEAFTDLKYVSIRSRRAPSTVHYPPSTPPDT